MEHYTLDSTKAKAPSIWGGLVVTAVLFILLPVTQWVSGITGGKPDIPATTVNLPPPPPPPPQVEEEPEPEQEQEEPELDKPQNQLSLDQLDLVLNAGAGSGFDNGLNMASFELSDSFEEDFIFELSELDQVPKVVRQIPPEFPYNLKRSGITGVVAVLFVVDEQGRVVNARVDTSSHPGFEDAALTAVRKWKFEPGKKGGKAVKVNMRVPLRFALQ